MDNNDINNADALLEELKNLNKSLKTELKKEQESNSTPILATSAVPVPVAPEIPLDEDNLSTFIFETSQKIIQSGLDTIATLKDTVANTEDSKTMLGFAEIISATIGAIDTLNSINIEKRKATTAKEIKNMDIQSRTQLKTSKIVNNTLNIVASREKIMAMLNEVENKRIDLPNIDAEFVEITPENNK